jgi:hypothetical protein
MPKLSFFFFGQMIMMNGLIDFLSVVRWFLLEDAADFKIF